MLKKLLILLIGTLIYMRASWVSARRYEVIFKLASYVLLKFKLRTYIGVLNVFCNYGLLKKKNFYKHLSDF